jgi:AraC family transcriptional regulator
MLFAGLSERYSMGGNAGIAHQWARFAPYLGSVQGAVPYIAYGVVYNTDDADSFDYMTAVEVRSFDELPAAFARLRVGPQRYAVFTHTGHITGIQASCSAIWRDWLPKSSYEPADAPFFERYDSRFDPKTGNGDVELWLALKT